MKKITFPAWFSHPQTGQSAIFESAEDVPNGWTSGAEKQTIDSKPAKEPAKSEPAPPPPANTPPADTPPADVELDANGHPYDPVFHAATKSKTTAGLWRMKVGVKRPDPAPGYPKSAPPLDL